MHNINIGIKEYETILAAIMFQVEQIKDAVADDSSLENSLSLAKKMACDLEGKLSRQDFNFTLEESQSIYSMLTMFREFCNDSLEMDLSIADHNKTLDYYKTANRLIRTYKKFFESEGIEEGDFLTIHRDESQYLN